MRPLVLLLLLLAALLLASPSARGQAAPPSTGAPEGVYSADDDDPAQRAALTSLLNAVAVGRNNATSLVAASGSYALGESGLQGSSDWGSNASYCTWWGVGCCSASLTNTVPPLCTGGANSVRALTLSAVGLEGRLPDVFAPFIDLQELDVSYNRREL